MNTTTLYEFLYLIQKDNQSNKIATHFTQMNEALSNMISNPGNSQHQVTFANAKTAILTALNLSATNDLTPKQKLMSVEMGIDDILGTKLSDQIVRLIEENQLTPAAIQKPLQSLNARITKFFNSANNLITSLNDLVPISNDNNECEMGVLIPNNYTKYSLNKITGEISEFEDLYLNIEEICENSRSGAKIISMSTTDPLVVIGASVTICACFAKSISWILDSYKTILEIRKLRSELLANGIAEKSVAEIDKDANNRIENNIDKLVDEIIKQFCITKDSGRINELRIELKYNLLKLAFKIDNGFAYEIKVKKEPQEDNSGNVNEKIEMIKKSSKEIEFTNLTGSPILRLPPPIDKDIKEQKAPGRKAPKPAK